METSSARLIGPNHHNKWQMCCPKKYNAHSTNNSCREEESHGPDTKERNQILCLCERTRHSRTWTEQPFRKSLDTVAKEVGVLTNQGRHEIRQTPGITALQNIDRQPSRIHRQLGSLIFLHRASHHAPGKKSTNWNRYSSRACRIT